MTADNQTQINDMRDRFEQEMRRVEEEMVRLRREFEGYTPKMNNGVIVSNHPPPPHQRQQQQHQQHHQQQHYANQQHQPHIYSNRSDRGGENSGGSGGGSSGAMIPTAGNPRPKYDPYLDNIKSPLIKNESDGKTLRLRFNLSQYRPEEVTLKTIDHRLLVHAKHEEKSPQRTVYREYNQEFMLPRGTDPESITSSLSTDGVLTVEAPLPQMSTPSVPIVGGGGGRQQQQQLPPYHQHQQQQHSPRSINHRGVF